MACLVKMTSMNDDAFVGNSPLENVSMENTSAESASVESASMESASEVIACVTIPN